MRFYSENLGFKGKSCDTFFPRELFSGQEKKGEKIPGEKPCPWGHTGKGGGVGSNSRFPEKKKEATATKIVICYFSSSFLPLTPKPAIIPPSFLFPP